MFYLVFLFGLLLDLEFFLCDGLKGENLSKKAKEKKDALIKRIKEAKLRWVVCLHLLQILVLKILLQSIILISVSPNSFPQDFKDKSKCFTFNVSVFPSGESGATQRGLSMNLRDAKIKEKCI